MTDNTNDSLEEFEAIVGKTLRNSYFNWPYEKVKTPRGTKRIRTSYTTPMEHIPGSLRGMYDEDSRRRNYHADEPLNPSKQILKPAETTTIYVAFDRVHTTRDNEYIGYASEAAPQAFCEQARAVGIEAEVIERESASGVKRLGAVALTTSSITREKLTELARLCLRLAPQYKQI